MTPRAFALAAVRRTARRLRPWLSDAAFDALYGWGHLGYVPRIERPRTFNEKLLWLRRHHRDPRMARLADKLEARRYAVEAVPGLRLPELLGVYERPDGHPFADLPDRAVLKSNHASGQVLVLRRPVDEPAVRARAARWLAAPYGLETREWAYSDVPRRLFAERFLGDDDTAPDDLKVYVLNGRADFVQVFRGRFGRLERTMFDLDWRPLPVYRGAIPGDRPVVPDPASLPARPGACPNSWPRPNGSPRRSRSRASTSTWSTANRCSAR